MIVHGCFNRDPYLQAVSVFDKAKFSVFKPYDDTPEILFTLKSEGYKLGLVTDTYHMRIICAWKRRDLRDISMLVSGLWSGHHKPHHAPFECVLDLLEDKPYEAMFIGDSLRCDIAPALAVGRTAVHAKYGSQGEYTYIQKISVESPYEILWIIHEKV